MVSQEHIATRRFAPEDQERFAALTGDRNPMHLDPAAARRTQAGDCAVHGVHGLLWALERLAADGAPVASASTLKVDFTRFVPVGREIALVVLGRAEDRIRAEIRVGGVRATALDLRIGARKALAPPPIGPEAAASPPPSRPAERELDEMEGLAGRLLPPAGGAGWDLFPTLRAALGQERVAAIGLASTLVGMVAPGLHSIFSGLQLAFGDAVDGPPGLGYVVRRADPRFRFVSIGIDGPGLSGSVTAFARFPPVAPASLARAAAVVAPGEFAGRRALIVGGSRGIGAATAKLIAAGGGDVTITYRHGRAEAEAIRDEIAQARGGGSCATLAYSSDAPEALDLASVAAPFTHVYYFATSHIFAGSDGFDRALFDGFVEVYAVAFRRLVLRLLERWPDAPPSVFYPSSIAIDERPQGMTEYAMAKAAGEILCVDLARAHRGLAVTMPRLPRILTDQTATVPPAPAADPLDVMPPLLRAERA